MKRKTYFTPESSMVRIATEQGICYSSGEPSQIDPNGENKGDVNVEDYTEVNNDITFD